MRVLFWNLGYGREHTGLVSGYLLKFHRFLVLSSARQNHFISNVANVVARVRPDIFSFAEISTGDTWNGHFNQHQCLLNELGDGRVNQHVLSKYGESVLNGVPFHRGNSNGVVSFVPCEIAEWYLAHSRKKLVLEVRLPGLRILTVHLPLVTRHRAAQLAELSRYIRDCSDDIIVCGDFNLFGGIDELEVLQSGAGLSIAPGLAPTYPAAKPKIALDVALYRFADKTTVPRLTVLPETLSDHCPIVVEWD